jgi:hypothetical protein
MCEINPAIPRRPPSVSLPPVVSRSSACRRGGSHPNDPTARGANRSTAQGSIPAGRISSTRTVSSLLTELAYQCSDLELELQIELCGDGLRIRRAGGPISGARAILKTDGIGSDDCLLNHVSRLGENELQRYLEGVAQALSSDIHCLPLSSSAAERQFLEQRLDRLEQLVLLIAPQMGFPPQKIARLASTPTLPPT